MTYRHYVQLIVLIWLAPLRCVCLYSIVCFLQQNMCALQQNTQFILRFVGKESIELQLFDEAYFTKAARLVPWLVYHADMRDPRSFSAATATKAM